MIVLKSISYYIFDELKAHFMNLQGEIVDLLVSEYDNLSGPSEPSVWETEQKVTTADEMKLLKLYNTRNR
jgi:hypothetical protein